MFRLVYYVSRKAAKIPLHIRNRLLLDEPGTSRQLHGSVYDQEFRGALGQRKYMRLCEDKRLSLVTIFYCQEELHGIRLALESSRQSLNPNHDRNERKKRLINHDYLVLLIRSGEGESFHIKAEKVAGVDEDFNQPGIHITILSDGFNDKDRKRYCLHRIDCNIYVALEDILATLKKESPTYDAVHNNCWDYARRTTKWLLNDCLNLLGARHSPFVYSPGEYSRLQGELENLKNNLAKKHIANTFQRMWTFVKTKLE